ncbi:ABC transporter permease [Mycetocola tolaasinivorans]|uniref:ABC transporter permease n=1 Tax=Mycetocola tolaasinivorans TaxID=76635 RepID=A0A3L7A4Y0_9MICO|nr:ABC transporter permease [Mycetocola tolaasinivorans]RLP75277.1 ABC transporter permease [Mycetocola tolaasinivorans]
MTPYILRRIGYALFVVWAAYTVTFVLLYLLPSDPVELMLTTTGAGESSLKVSDEARAALTAKYGFDQPFIIQYLMLLGRALTGNFGDSLQHKTPITELIVSTAPQTLQLAGLALLFSLIIGVGIALLANFSRSNPVRSILFSLPPVAASLPAFWIGLLLLQFFSYQLKWFPALGNNGFPALVLPALTLAIPAAATYAQILGRGMAKELHAPYIDIVRAKGASRARVQLVHAFRNAMLPALTILGITIGGILAGAVVTETVFSRRGLGRLLQGAVDAQDIPLVQTLVILSAVAFAVANLAVDLIYPLLDPRIARAGR